MSFFYFVIGSSSLMIMAMPFYYDRYIVKPYLGMPEPVAAELRKVFHYEKIQPDAKQALKHYKKALLATVDTGMDPFSDETLGIKIRYAEFFEKRFHYELALDVLQVVRSDCARYVQLFGDEHFQDGKRTRVLAWAVRCSTKMGELYALPWVEEPEKAEEAFSWAVETILKEKRRREVEGTQPGEGGWIAGEEFGGAMERLAHQYEEKNQHEFAAPLFLQALAVCPTNTCHAAVLMNNLATSLAHQPRRTAAASRAGPPPPTPQPRERKSGFMKPLKKLNPFSSSQTPEEPSENSLALASVQMLDPVLQATQWANMAISTADKVTSEHRNEECDQAKIAALYNLGELAEQGKNTDEAAQHYQKAKSLAKKVGWIDGVKTADEALRRTQQAANP